VVLPGPSRRCCGRYRHHCCASQRGLLVDEQTQKYLGKVGSCANAVGVCGRTVVLPNRESVAFQLDVLIRSRLDRKCDSYTSGRCFIALRAARMLATSIAAPLHIVSRRIGTRTKTFDCRRLSGVIAIIMEIQTANDRYQRVEQIAALRQCHENFVGLESFCFS
jgi:hypothetical protein